MAQYPPPQYPPQYPQQQYPPPAPSTSGAAIVSLIASISAFFIFPILGSIVGIIAGNSAKNDIRNRPYQVTGEGLAQAGIIIGWIGLGLTVLGICGFVLLGGIPLALGLCAAVGSSGSTSMLPMLPMAGLVLTPVLLKLK
jgi:hypothetical protein